jgi:hypothetical protein
MHLHLPESGLPAYRMARGRGEAYIQCSLLIGAQSLDKGFHQQCRLITSLIPAGIILLKRPRARWVDIHLGKRSCSSLSLIIQLRVL